MKKIYRALYTSCISGTNFQSSTNFRDGQKLFSTGGDMGLSAETLSMIESEIGRDVYNSGLRPYNKEACRFLSFDDISVLIHYRWMPQEETGSREFGMTKALIGKFDRHPVEYLSCEFFNGNDYFFDYKDADKKKITSYKQLLTFQGEKTPPLFKALSTTDLFKLPSFSEKMSLETAGGFVLQTKKIAERLRAAVCHLVKQFAKPDETQRQSIVIKGTPEQIRYWFAAIGYAFSSVSAQKLSFSIGLPPIGFSYSFSTSTLVGWDKADPDLAKLGDSLSANLVYLEKLSNAEKGDYYDAISKFDTVHEKFALNFKPTNESDTIGNYPNVYRDFAREYERIVREERQKEAERLKRVQEAFNRADETMRCARSSEDFKRAITAFEGVDTTYQDINRQVKDKIAECVKKRDESAQRESAQRTFDAACRNMKQAQNNGDYQGAISAFEVVLEADNNYQDLKDEAKKMIAECKRKKEEAERMKQAQDSFDVAYEMMNNAQTSDDCQKAITAFQGVAAFNVLDITRQINAMINKCLQKKTEITNRKRVQDSLDDALNSMEAAQSPEDFRIAIGRFESSRSNYQDLNVQIDNYIAECLQKEIEGIKKATIIGEIPYNDGGIYHGEKYKEIPHGWGTMSWANGDKYIGMWSANSRCGWGVMIFANGGWEAGEWQIQEPQFVRGLRYVANNPTITPIKCQLVNNILFNGGYINQCYFAGDIVEGFIQGWGTIGFPDGCYTGEWEKGHQHGRGIYRYADGRILMGSWVQGIYQKPIN